MAGYVILGVLAAYGALCAVWAALGWLLPAGQGCALVCWGEPDEGILARYHWLKGTGLLNCPLLTVAEAGADCPETERCAGEELLSRLEMERKRFDGTGDGDHSGHHQRGGVPEL